MQAKRRSFIRRMIDASGRLTLRTLSDRCHITGAGQYKSADDFAVYSRINALRAILTNSLASTDRSYVATTRFITFAPQRAHHRYQILCMITQHQTDISRHSSEHSPVSPKAGDLLLSGLGVAPSSMHRLEATVIVHIFHSTPPCGTLQSLRHFHASLAAT